MGNKYINPKALFIPYKGDIPKTGNLNSVKDCDSYMSRASGERMAVCLEDSRASMQRYRLFATALESCALPAGYPNLEFVGYCNLWGQSGIHRPGVMKDLDQGLV